MKYLINNSSIINKKLFDNFAKLNNYNFRKFSFHVNIIYIYHCIFVLDWS